MPEVTWYRYREFELLPRPLLLRTGEWTTEVHISRFSRGGIHVAPFSVRNTWETEEQAIAACLDFGRKLVEGEIPGIGVDALP